MAPPADFAHRSTLLCVLLCLLAAAAPQIAHPFGRAEEPLEIGDPREEWRCLFTELDGEEVAGENRYLLTSLPLLIAEHVRQIPTHILSEEEREARRVRLIRLRIAENERRMAELTEERNRTFLQGDDQKLEALDSQIEGIRRESSKLRAAIERGRDGPETGAGVAVLVKDRAPYSTIAESERRSLGPHPELPLRHYARLREADAVVYGALERLDDALFLTLHLYNADRDTSRLVYSRPVFPDAVEESAREVADELTEYLLGREWAELALTVSPEHADVQIGERIRSGGSGRIRYMEPGDYQLRAGAPGYFEEERSLTLSPGKTERVEISLSPRETVDLTIVSDPPGSEISDGATPVGTAPLTMEEVVLPLTIIASREGYYDHRTVVGQLPPEGILDINMHPETIGREQIIESARSRFYRGVAGFFLTLPITVISYGMSTEYSYAYTDALENSQADYDERVRLHGMLTVWYTAYLGGLFLNGVFLFDSIVHMQHYIRASEGR